MAKSTQPDAVKHFWETKPLSEMSREEWESLCDGCARCCLIKLEDEESGDLYTTAIACRYLDTANCRCGVYSERTSLVPDCVAVTKENLDRLYFMPRSCGYRLLAEGKPLPEWHPLVSDSSVSVHEAGISIRDIAILEQDLPEDADPEEYILD